MRGPQVAPRVARVQTELGFLTVEPETPFSKGTVSKGTVAKGAVAKGAIPKGTIPKGTVAKGIVHKSDSRNTPVRDKHPSLPLTETTVSADTPRIACVHLPSLPLQLLLRTRPSWRDVPAVVIAEESPNAPVLHANRAAREARISIGMRWNEARGLCADLRAAPVTPSEITQFERDLLDALGMFSPRVESAGDGVFFLDPEGLSILFGDMPNWARSVHSYLAGRKLRAALVVGWHRFRVESVARTRRGPLVLGDPQRELELAQTVKLERLACSPALLESLGKLGVRSLGDLLGLPGDALRVRFGEEAALLHARAAEGPVVPVQPKPLIDPVSHELELESPDSDQMRLLFALKGPLEGLVDEFTARGEALAGLRLTLSLEQPPSALGGVPTRTLTVHVEPAKPTRELPLLLDLLRLRLGALQLPAPVVRVRLEAGGQRHRTSQMGLFDSPAPTNRTPAKAETQSTTETHSTAETQDVSEARRPRDLEAAGRALARVRAAFGEGAATRAKLRAAHLPEAGFSFEPVQDVRLPRALGEPRPEQSVLVRRLLPEPRPLPARDPVTGPKPSDEIWPRVEPRHGALAAMTGPYRVSGGWWVRTVERDYYYVETKRGDLLWVYYDRPRRTWFLHGIVD